MLKSSTFPLPSSYLNQHFTSTVYRATPGEAGYSVWVRGRFEQIYEHEKTHVQSALTAAGIEYATMSCAFFFLTSSFVVSSVDNSPREFIDSSEALETVGTSGYAGAIQYPSNKADLTAAASILATEACHASIDPTKPLEQPHLRDMCLLLVICHFS
jgi:hypothetical protein